MDDSYVTNKGYITEDGVIVSVSLNENGEEEWFELTPLEEHLVFKDTAEDALEDDFLDEHVLPQIPEEDTMYIDLLYYVLCFPFSSRTGLLLLAGSRLNTIYNRIARALKNEHIYEYHIKTGRKARSKVLKLYVITVAGLEYLIQNSVQPGKSWIRSIQFTGKPKVRPIKANTINMTRIEKTANVAIYAARMGARLSPILPPETLYTQAERNNPNYYPIVLARAMEAELEQDPNVITGRNINPFSKSEITFTPSSVVHSSIAAVKSSSLWNREKKAGNQDVITTRYIGMLSFRCAPVMVFAGVPSPRNERAYRSELSDFGFFFKHLRQLFPNHSISYRTDYFMYLCFVSGVREFKKFFDLYRDLYCGYKTKSLIDYSTRGYVIPLVPESMPLVESIVLHAADCVSVYDDYNLPKPKDQLRLINKARDHLTENGFRLLVGFSIVYGNSDYYCLDGTKFELPKIVLALKRMPRDKKICIACFDWQVPFYKAVNIAPYVMRIPNDIE